MTVCCRPRCASTEAARRQLLRKVVADLESRQGEAPGRHLGGTGNALGFILAERRDGRARDSFRTCRYCAARPSIWCWRDHSAGKSARRATPIPCGSRPSMAAVTRSGSALGRVMRRDREGGVRQADTMGRGIAHSERTPVSARPINAGHLDNLIKFKSSS